MPASVPAARAQGGTSARRTGAALSFVSCIALFGSSFALRVLRGPGLPSRMQLSNDTPVGMEWYRQFRTGRYSGSDATQDPDDRAHTSCSNGL